MPITDNKKSNKKKGDNNDDGGNNSRSSGKIEFAIDRVCTLIVIFGLSILSMAPHQEPRFLLPLVVPLVVLHGWDVIFFFTSNFCSSVEWDDSGGDRPDQRSTYRGRLFHVLHVLIWVIFNFLLLIFFGLWHQSGVVPSLLLMENIIGKEIEQKQKQAHRQCQPYTEETHPASSCDTNDNDLFAVVSEETVAEKYPQAILYYHTYMPPTFLSRPYHHPAVHETTLSSFQYEHYYPIIDLKGSDKENLLDMLSTYLPCSKCGKDREKDLKMLDGNTDSSAFNSDDITDKTGGYVYIVAPPVTLLGDTLTKIANSNIKEKGEHDDQQTVGSSNQKEYLSDIHCSFFEKQNYSCRQVWTHHAHISTEDMPHWKGSLANFWHGMELSYYEIACDICPNSI